VTHAEILTSLRVRGVPIGLSELATRLIASTRPLPSALARRVVAAALARPAPELPDPLPAESLAPPPEGADDATPLADASFAVVDLETTGLSPQRSAIIEIGAVRVAGMRLVDRFETLVNPARAVPPEITELTGIEQRMLVGAPRLEDALARFRGWLDAAPGAPFVAHNARFDEGFVRRGFARSGLAPLAAPVLCTRKLARRLVPELQRFGLARLADAFGIRNRAPHRALGDAEATAEALVCLLERARRDRGLGTVGELLAFQARAPGARPARVAPGAGR
jgi:DNA polymerase III epsilon subunit family exonuclease